MPKAKDPVPTSDPSPAPPVPMPRIAVLERRLQNPFGEPSAPIDLKDSSLECRWFNAAIASDKVWRAKMKGWSPVTPDMLRDLDQVGGYVKSPDGFVTRGDRGQEVLMAMPKDWRREIQLAKTRENNRNMGNPNAMKQEIVSAAGDQLGDQAADFLQRRMGIIGQVTDGREVVERIEPVE